MKERLIGDDQLLVTADTTLGDALWDWVAADAATARRGRLAHRDDRRRADLDRRTRSRLRLRPARDDRRHDVGPLPPLIGRPGRALAAEARGPGGP